MPGLHSSGRPGDGSFSARNIFVGAGIVFSFLLVATPASAAQAAWTGFLVVATFCAWVMSRGSLEGLSAQRRHRARVFEGDVVPITLSVRQSKGIGQSLVLVEDHFSAALKISQRHLIPMMSRRWEANLHCRREAERHRGLYLLGPVRMWAADPLGVFFRNAEVDCVTRLTVYPHAVDLGGYRLMGPHPQAGPGMESYDRVGQGEEIVSVRPYQQGDPTTRIHWRTSVRRGQLHTMEVDSHVQTEAALCLDLTRPALFGTGAEATIEIAIGCATSILTQSASLRHRMSLTLVRDGVESLPPGAGINHLHMLLDRLAVVNCGGNLRFWQEVAAPTALLATGSRAIFIVPAATTTREEACPLVSGLMLKGVAVDIILIDESHMARIWRGQAPTLQAAEENFVMLKDALEQAGARVLALRRGQTSADLMPHAARDTALESTALR